MPDIAWGDDPRSGIVNHALPAINGLQKERGLPPLDLNKMWRGQKQERPTL